MLSKIFQYYKKIFSIKYNINSFFRNYETLMDQTDKMCRTLQLIFRSRSNFNFEIIVDKSYIT